MSLDLSLEPAQVALAMVNTPSVSDNEGPLCDAIAEALAACPHLELLRDGDTLVARTFGSAPGRVVLAGHIDTVPVADNLPGDIRVLPDAGPHLWGRGSVDMKGGLAVMAYLAARIDQPRTEVTWVFYDHEEVDMDRSGLARVIANHPDWLAGDFAVLTEPTSARIEGGCQGTLRINVTAKGKAAHSARGWLGVNAIHGIAPVLNRLIDHRPARVEVDGLEFPEGLNAVMIKGGIAGNVIPDACTVAINYRFAPDKTVDQALAQVTEMFDDFEVTLADSANGARPGLNHPVAQELVALVGGETIGKYGWTDVARFTALGIPAVNYGPGDPALAHADNEACPISQIDSVTAALAAWLTA
ncbi:MAG: succinyl-diaminopimelate desuccinylase [Micrococcales bacterium]|nr:succinyl-diaminopimelate desuccinylase [Micrococcales bacterium]